MMKQQILFITPNLGNGGAERSLANLLQLMDYSIYDVDLLLFQKRGMFLKQIPKEVHIITDEQKDLAEIYQDGGLKEQIKKTGLIKFGRKVFATAFSRVLGGKGLKHKQYRWKLFYRHFITECQKEYDIAAAYLEAEPTYYLVDKVHARKKIGWVHNEYTKSGLCAKLDRPYFEALSDIVTISDKCAEILRDNFPTVADRVSVLPNLTASTVIRSLAMEFVPEEYPNDKTVLVSIGRLHPQKGFDMAIEAASLLKKKKFVFSWYILGSGALREKLLSQAKKANVEDCIFFVGSRENPYPYLRCADVVVQPSRYEGKSIVLDEAKILGKPIVATNYTTVCDQLSEEEGMIVGMTAEEIAAGIMQMQKCKERYSNYLLQHEYGNAVCIEAYNTLFLS